MCVGQDLTKDPIRHRREQGASVPTETPIRRNLSGVRPELRDEADRTLRVMKTLVPGVQM